MCGIVGYVGNRTAESLLIDGLSRLEYRGYDSAGIATLSSNGPTNNTTAQIRRSVGKLQGLRDLLTQKPCLGNVGIGHTRWATHGMPTEENAHPHQSEGITIVHNGIIENHYELRKQLEKEGRVFESDTDSEILAHLIAKHRAQSSSIELAVHSALKNVNGAFALCVLDKQSPDRIICAKTASPLVIGIGENETHIASDFSAILPYTRNFHILKDGDLAIIESGKVQIFDKDHKATNRPIKRIDWSLVMAEKGGHKHFMHKEIFDQPRAISDTLRGRLEYADGDIRLDNIDLERLKNINRIVMVACGSSYHAGLLGKYLIEERTGLTVEVELASEFRYRNPIVNDKTLVIGITQSGETADTLAALQMAKEKQALLLSICNVIESAVPRLCGSSVGTLYTRAGPEISVASTKAFVTQVIAIHLLTLALGSSHNGMSQHQIMAHMESLSRLPRNIEEILGQEDTIRGVAQNIFHSSNMLFLGRGAFYPIALEGALKMKEISYIHAEGYAAGEMKHGPIALIDEKMPVVVIAMKGNGYDKIVSNIEEAKARGGRIIAVCEEGDENVLRLCDYAMPIPCYCSDLAPILAAIPLQLLAYHVADLRGTDVDQPRNLAKSVTVE